MFKILTLTVGLFSFERDSIDFKTLQTISLCHHFKQLLINIREQQISPDSAKKSFQHIVGHLKYLYPSKGDTSNARLVFPIKGYNYKAIGGNGSGFRPKGFDLFDHKKKGSHPAHDIFIRDINQDSKDDKTQEVVDLLAVRDGLVLATETNWKPESDYRGGNIIWLYDPALQGLFYYAHSKSVNVEMACMLRAGEKIGEVGRTGFNAAKPRSGTHLHFVYLQIDKKTNLPKPINTYTLLKQAVVIK